VAIFEMPDHPGLAAAGPRHENVNDAENKGTLSSHLARLEEAGYVKIDKKFFGKVPRTLLRLTPAGRNAFDGYRKQMRKVF
jgi:DNA-binding MarR family transcriptional regulator